MLCGKRALDKMAADDLFGLSNGGQVQTLIPTQQQFQVGIELTVGTRRQRGNAGLNERLFYLPCCRIQGVSGLGDHDRAASRKAANKAREAGLLS